MADEVVWPADRCVPIGALPAAQAALLPDAVATAYHALGRAQVPLGGLMCVIGAGGVGSHVLELARILDPTVKLACVVRRPESAARFANGGVVAVAGLERAARRLKEEMGEFDVVLDFSGAAAGPREGLRALRRGGRLVLGSVRDEPLELGTTTGVVTREAEVVGSYSSTIGDLEQVAALAEQGSLQLDGSVSGTFPLDEAGAAFAALEDRPPGLVRLVLQPSP
jgi:2-desacetyl-2-hydroxyethyl bacteriochlorophyllide A dehydrogenase